MARRAAGPAGPLHSAQDPAPGEVDPVGTADPESLERLRASLLHGRAAHAAPLRVEDPVHLPPGSDDGWTGDRWSGAGWAQAWPDDAADPDDLAGDESAVMHPDDLAALHTLPTTTAETRAWTGDGAQDDAWTRHPPEPGAQQAEGRRLVGTAQGLSLWEEDPSWSQDDSWDHEPAWDDEPTGGLLRQRWLQLTLCALLALVVGASLALLFTGHQVDAARAEADRQRQAASSAQADLVRERAARASERAGDAGPPPVRAAPLDEPEQAPGTDPAVVAPPPPTDPQRPPVAESPAPTADPGPPPPGPSPVATTPPPSRSSTSPPSAPPPASDDAAQDDPRSDQAAAPSGSQTCAQASGSAEGDGPTTCP